MKATISNKLSRAINWEGGKGKLAFKKLKLSKAIAAVQLKHFPDGNLIITKDAVKRWLNTSGGRSVKEEESSEAECDGSDAENGSVSDNFPNSD